jgi:hypothetical protein
MSWRIITNVLACHLKYEVEKVRVVAQLGNTGII